MQKNKISSFGLLIGLIIKDSKLIALALIIFSLINSLGSTVFIIFIMLFESYIFLSHKSSKKYVINSLAHRISLTLPEESAAKRYPLLFIWPMTSRGYSSTLSLIQMATIILVPMMLIKHLWIKGVIIAINYIIAGKLAVLTNPQFFLHDAVEKRKKLMFLEEMESVDSIMEKLYSKATENIKKI